MPTVGFRCKCINECVALGIPRGMILGGTIRIDEYGYNTFVVELTCGGPLTCGQEMFASYFRIID